MKIPPALLTEEEMLEYRANHFAVEVEKSRHSPKESEEFNLSVTHNGHLWQSIGLLPHEAREVVRALENYLSTLEIP